MSKRNLLFPFLFVFATVAYAQNCSENLEQAKRAYFNGNFQQATDLLQSCVETEWNQREKTEALEILIKSNLIQLKKETADQYMMSLLSVSPLYAVRESDLIEFKNLFNEYEIRTRWNVGLRIGGNQQYYSVLHYQSYGSNTQEPASYKAKIGFSAGITGEYAITKKIFVSLEALYQTHGYSQTEIIQDYQRVSITENLAYINTPLQLQYQMKIKGLTPFVSAGIGLHYLLKSEGDISLLALEPEFFNLASGIPQLTENYNLKSQRKPVTLNYVFGSGVRKSFGLTSIELAVHYEFGCTNLVDTKNRYDDNTLYDTYSYVPDDFKMNHLRITAGVFKTIVYPKKKNK